MRTFTSIILCLAILISLSANPAYSQCCTAGNPETTDNDPGQSQKNAIKISLSQIHSTSDQYYSGNKVVDYSYIDKSFFNFTLLNASYGLSKNLRLTAELGYFWIKAQEFSFGFERSSNGLGDLKLGASYLVPDVTDMKLNFSPYVKFGLPVGEFDQMNGPVVLPIDIQPSSGSFRYQTGLMIFRSFMMKRAFLLMNTNIEYSQRINTDRTNYKYGNLYNLGLTGSYKFTKKLSFALTLRNQWRDKASDSNFEILNSTGGYHLFCTPQVVYKPTKKFAVSALYERPLYRNIRGKQLSNKHMFSIKISATIKTKKQKEEQKEIPLDTNGLSASIWVNGICGMCKERIERIALEDPNIYYASWDINTKTLTVGYHKEFDINKLKERIAAGGHDTDKYLADDEVYNNLHHCCKYRE